MDSDQISKQIQDDFERLSSDLSNRIKEAHEVAQSGYEAGLNAVGDTTTLSAKLDTAREVVTDIKNKVESNIKTDVEQGNKIAELEREVRGLKAKLKELDSALFPDDDKDASIRDMRRTMSNLRIQLTTLGRLGGAALTVFGTGGLATLLFSLAGGESQETVQFQNDLREAQTQIESIRSTNDSQTEEIRANRDHIGQIDDRIFRLITDE